MHMTILINTLQNGERTIAKLKVGLKQQPSRRI